MKNILLFLGLVGLTFHSCDVIEEPVRIEKNPYLENTYGPAPSFNVPTEATKNVLVEEYTGHLCGFCPEATALVLALDETLGNRMVTVSIHAGTLAEPSPGLFSSDYRTEAGDLYWTQLGGGLNPSARIDRVGGLTNFYYLDPGNPDSWQSIINSQLNVSTPVALQGIADYIPNDNKINIHINSHFVESYSGSLNLVVLLVENHIISPQEDYTATPSEVEDYEHEHVLRTAVTEPMGNALITSPNGGTSITKSFTVPVSSTWNGQNLVVVAYLLDPVTNEIINALEVYAQ
ncbi:MAG: Omp28-related outer membrane protein [Bacteroidetes bacterium]|nr:Omp28-related outer membrane protein [Bacteroidota bacterium]